MGSLGWSSENLGSGRAFLVRDVVRELYPCHFPKPGMSIVHATPLELCSLLPGQLVSW